MNQLMMHPLKYLGSSWLQAHSGYEKKFDLSTPSGLKDVETKANITWTSTLDGDPVCKKFNNFIINEGHTVTVSNRCKGLYLMVAGNLIVNGTLSMTARGANAVGRHILIDKNGVIYYYVDEYDKSQYDENFAHISATGGIGVSAATGIAATNINSIYKFSTGAAGVNGACGAGGNAFNKGGNGTSFSGGAGAGGNGYEWLSSGGGNAWRFGAAGANNGGAGGTNGVYQRKTRAGTGAGNPPGALNNTYGSKGAVGTGGLIIIFCKGNIIIGDNGKIEANGSKGGNGVATTSSSSTADTQVTGSGGSGSGGGAIHIFYNESITNVNRIYVSGGAAGISGRYSTTEHKQYSWNGAAGGAGSKIITQYTPLLAV